MSVPANLNPDNISLREMTPGERFSIMFGRPIPRCEWTGYEWRDDSTACGKVYDSQRDFTFCPNCGFRIKFITK